MQFNVIHRTNFLPVSDEIFHLSRTIREILAVFSEPCGNAQNTVSRTCNESITDSITIWSQLPTFYWSSFGVLVVFSPVFPIFKEFIKAVKSLFPHCFRGFEILKLKRPLAKLRPKNALYYTQPRRSRHPTCMSGERSDIWIRRKKWTQKLS